MYLPAYPDIAQYFGVREGLMNYTMCSYMAGLGIGQLTWGPISDRFGRFRPMTISLIFFVITCFLCATTQSFTALVFYRFLQAFVASSTLVIVRAIIADLYTSPKKDALFAYVIAINMFSPIFAPFLGGWLITYVDWQWIFIIIGISGVVILNLFVCLLSKPYKNITFYTDWSTLMVSWKKLCHDPAFLLMLASYSCISSCGIQWVSYCPAIILNTFQVSPMHFGIFFAIPAIGCASGAIAVSYMMHHIQRNQGMQLMLYLLLFSCGLFASLLVYDLTMKSHLFIVVGAITLLMAISGMITPIMTAFVLAQHPEISGASSGLLGFGQMMYTTLVSAIASYLYEYAVMSMTLSILITSLLALAAFLPLFKQSMKKTIPQDISLDIDPQESLPQFTKPPE